MASSETKHTEGPWHSEDTNSARLSKVVVADKLGANGSTVIIGQMMGPDVEGNCRLVVAAPNMLAALRLSIEYDEILLKFKGPRVIFDGDVAEIDAAYDKWVAAARSAISQAE